MEITTQGVVVQEKAKTTYRINYFDSDIKMVAEDSVIKISRALKPGLTVSECHRQKEYNLWHHRESGRNK